MSGFWKRIRRVGPALVLAAVVLGPGSLTLNTLAGSRYGYRLLWVPVLATGFMITYTWMAARLGLVTRQTLFQVTRRRFGPRLARVGGIFGFLAILSFQAGNNAGVGFSAQALLGGDVRLWALLFFLPALGLIFLPGLYGKLEILVKWVVGVMMAAFAGTLALVGVKPGPALQGLVPGFPDADSIFLSLGMASTTFSIAAAAYQCHLMREKKWGPGDLRQQGLDTFLGIAILGGISAVILLTSAGVLQGQPVFSAQAMALQLEPMVGPAAFYLFTLGFFFASFSSLVVNPLIGATLLADGLGQDPSMDGRPVKLWTAAAMAAGLAVVLIFQGSPLELLRIAQALSVVAFPLLGFLVLFLSSDRTLMGPHANKVWVQGVGFLGYLAILAIVANYARQILEDFMGT